MSEVIHAPSFAPAKNWRDVVLPWGKHEGWTMFQCYVNDFGYVRDFLAEKCHDPVIKAAAVEAVHHKERVDPFSQ